MSVVVFTAPCPACGEDCRWTQTGNADSNTVRPDNFTIACDCTVE